MVWHRLLVGLQDETYRQLGRESTKILDMISLPCQSFRKTFTKIEVHLVMSERLTRDLEIEEALKMEIKYTLEQRN